MKFVDRVEARLRCVQVSRPVGQPNAADFSAGVSRDLVALADAAALERVVEADPVADLVRRRVAQVVRRRRAAGQRRRRG